MSSESRPTSRDAFCIQIYEDFSSYFHSFVDACICVCASVCVGRRIFCNATLRRRKRKECIALTTKGEQDRMGHNVWQIASSSWDDG